MAACIGAKAVSAVSALSQITLMVTALGSGLAVGSSIKISEAYGRGDDGAVQRRVSTVYILAVLVSLVLAVTLIPFAKPFLRLLQTPEELITAGVGYFRIEILTLVIQFFNTVYIAIARSRGQTKMILALNMVVIVVKLGLSAVFVYVLHGGVTMIAVATLVSQTLPWLAEIFARSENNFDQEFCDMIVAIHRWEMLGYITLGINSATIALLLGYGYSKLTMILNVARVFVYRVPVLWAFQQFTDMGAEAVGMTMMISNVCTGLTAICFGIPVVLKIRKRIREEELAA